MANATMMEDLARITAAEFYAAAASLGNSRTTKWEWVPVEGDEGYLLRRNEPWTYGEDTLPDSMAELHVVYSEAFQVCEVVCIACTLEALHVVRVQVPALFFNAFFLDGSLLPLPKVMERFQPPFSSNLSNTAGPGEFVIQQEHPILGRPFYEVHPCRTQESMDMIMNSGTASDDGAMDSEPSRHYLRTWLSFVESTLQVSPPVSDYLFCTWHR